MVDSGYCNKRPHGGVVPFGWYLANDGTLVEHRLHQELILQMIEARHNGRSYRTIAEALRQKWSVTLSHEGVRKILAAAADRGVDIVAVKAWRAAV
jgi:hypothetical protein